MKRPAKKVRRSQFVVALSGPGCVARIPSQRRLLGNQEIAAVPTCQSDRLSADLYLDQAGLSYTGSAVREYQLRLRHVARLCRTCELGVRICRSYREKSCARPAVRCRRRPRRLSMIYFAKAARSDTGRSTGRRLANSDRNHRDGRPIWPCERRACALLRELREHYGSRWPRMRDGIERAGKRSRNSALRFRRASGRTTCTPSASRSSSMTAPALRFNCGARIPFHGRTIAQRY